MKAVIRLVLLSISLFMVNSLSATVFVSSTSISENVADIQLSKFTVKDYQTLVGRKLSLRDKIVFHFAKSDMMKTADKVDKATFKRVAAETSSGFNLGGFLLGFLFSLVGVLIALLFGGNVVRWAWKGFLVGLVVALISYLVSKKTA